MSRAIFAVIGLLVVAWTPLQASSAIPATRHLQYSLNTTVSGLVQSAVVDLDVGAFDEAERSPVVLSERLVDADLGRESVTLDRTGAIRGASTALTFEERVLLDALALQFENMRRVARGAQWDLTSEESLGTQTMHVSVLKSIARDQIDLAISQTTAFLDGAIGNWSGRIRYDTAIIVPTSIFIVGQMPVGAPAARHLGAITLSAKLIGDSFSP